MNRSGEAMALREETEELGNWLFKWRSYLPLLIAGIVVASLVSSSHVRRDHGSMDAWEVLCLLISFLGLGIRVYTVGFAPGGTSGRTTSCPEASQLNTTGIYSVVRHPLYLGNFFIWLGVSMFPGVWWTPLFIAVIFYWYYEKIMLAEEAFLRERFGLEFEAWADRTPAFVPRLRNWIPNVLPFSSRNALKREYSGLMAIILSFTILQILGGLFARRRFELDWTWSALFATGLAAYLVLRFLKKKTRILSVEGR
uniref:Lipid A phosphate methyltransferase n=1 Tax=uncultured Latescibacterota bacterium TaxID=199737 RepID=Q2YZW7_9BACT|nr:hypothetical protein [uncultured Latescibacterota bacterium]